MSDYNIGNIYAELAMDTSSLESSKRKAIKELGNLRDEGDKILKEAGGKMTEAMKIRLDEIEKNKSAVLKSIDDLNKQIREKSNPMKEVIGLQIESAIMQPMKAFAAASVDTFTQFQQSMQNTFSVMGASASDMQLLEETAKKMGETTRFSASQASQALYSLGSAGQSASEAINSLQGVLRLAGATGSELAYTSETIASTLSQFNLEASKASHIADVYAKAISKSQANMTKLSYSMKYVGPVASGLGISLETTTAALMKLYNTGYGGEQAGTYLKQAFQKLASGTDDLKNKLQELGLSYDDVNPQTRNFADIISTLKEKNIGVTESIAIFGETAGGAMAKLIEEGGDAISTMEGLLKSSEGAAAEMQEIQNASFANTKAELMSAMEAVQITTGSILEPALNVLAKGFTEVLKSVNGLPIGMQTFITTMLSASTAIVPFLTMPALITKIKGAMDILNVSMLHNPIFIGGAVVTAIAAAFYSVYQRHKKNQEMLLKEATRGVEDIREMYKKANEAGEKGRNIQGLLSQYEILKDKTNKTKEEQEAYNQTLKDLQNLVPGVVIEVGKTGEAYIANTNKIKTAILEELRLSQTLKQQALVSAKYRAQIAEQEEKVYQKKNEGNKKKQDDIIRETNLIFKYSDKIEELKKKGKAGEKEIKELLSNLQSIFPEKEITMKTSSGDFGDFRKEEVSYDQALKNLDNVLENSIIISKNINNKQQEELDILLNTQKTKAEVNQLIKEIEEGNKAIEASKTIEAPPPPKPETKKEVVKTKTTKETTKEEKQIKEIEEKTAYTLEQARQEYEKKKAELWEVLTHLHNAKAKLDQFKTKDDKTSFDEENINFLQREIDSLQDKAKSLSTELGKDYVLLDDIDNKITELENKDTNTFTSKLKHIKEVQDSTLKAIKSAQEAGNIDEATASSKIKKINAAALKASVTVGAELSKTILSVGNNVTDIILGAIEKGELSLAESLNIVSQIGGQLAEMIPDPMTKAVLGAVQLGINLISKIIHYAENVKKENEEAYNKAMEEDDRKRQEKARTLAGDTASFYAKQMSLAKKGANDFNTILNEMANKVKDNALSDAIKTLGEAKTTQLKDVWIEREKKEWYQYKDKFGNDLWWYGKHTVGSWEKAQMSINELIVEWKKAVEKGDTQLANKLKKAIDEGAKKHFLEKDVNIDEINNLKNYMQGIEEAFVDAIKQKDFGALKDAMREKIRDAMLAKLQQTIIFSKLAPLLKKLEEAGETQKGKIINEINEEMEKSYNNYDKFATKFLGDLGLVSSELEEHRKSWRGLKNTITEALSNTLGEAAYNADWASFKKAFANEMKKAIISSTVASAGLKTKIDKIIKDIMADGQITQDEINNSIDGLQGYFDQLEGSLAPLAKLTKALEDGTDVKSEHKGTIIQQLSGADRDYFAEEFRKNFASMADNFKSAMIDLKEIHQAQITVQMATLSVRDIYINSERVTDFKGLIAEMIEEARKAG